MKLTSGWLSLANEERRLGQMSKKILLIEDKQPDRQFIQQVLKKVGYKVIEAMDGSSGIQLAQDEQPDLILTDIRLPDMDGLEVATHIRSLPELGDTPIIAMMAQSGPCDHQTFDACIAKPVDVNTLNSKVAEFLENRRNLAALEQENARLRKYSKLLADRLERKIQELTAANEALAHTDTMKSRFINLAAHELRTPLAAVLGYLSVLTSPDSKFMATADENTQELIDGITSGIDRLRGLVQDMLDVTRIEAETLQLRYAPVQLSLILDKIQRDFKDVATGRQQRLIVADACHVPIMWIDGERVTQILRNLVSNAIKYTPDGGAIEITVDTIESDDQKNPFVRITVSDGGVGIPKDQQERIFKSLYEVGDIELHSSSKTNFMGGGAGLGLPIARGVAEAHGGWLWVESEGYDPECCPGSKFHLVLPVGKPPKYVL
jgi:signal transduction histidine kinase